MTERSRAKRLVGGIYSAIADNLYEPIVVHGAFRLFARHLHDTIRDRGRLAAELAEGGPILDMPVGTAYFTTDMAAHHAGVVIGVDIAEGMVREAQGAARRAGVGNVQPLRADAHRLPFGDGSFAVVVCWNGLQVIPGTDETVRELARVLRPGGTLLASTVHLPLDRALSERAARRLPPMFVGRDRFAASFRGAGLTIDAIEPDGLATIFTAHRSFNT